MRIKKQDIKSNLYYIIISLFVIYNMIFVLSTIGDKIVLSANFRTVLISILIFGLLIIIFNTRYTIKEFVRICILLLTSLFVTLFTYDDTILLFCLFCVAIKDISMEDVFRKTFFVELILTIVIIFLALVGEIDNKFTVGFSIWDYRIYLGYKHPNFCGTIFVNLILLLYIIREGNFKFREYIFSVVLMIIDFVGPKSKTMLIITSALIGITLIQKFVPTKMYKKLIELSKYLPLVVMAATLVMVLNYHHNEDVFVSLNDFLSTRLEQTSYYFNKYDITLFGQPIEQVTYLQVFRAEDVHTLDNGYMYLLLGKGLLFTVMYICMAVMCIKRLMRQKMNYLVIVMSLILLWGFMETYMFRIEMCIPSLLFGIALFNNVFGNQDKSYMCNGNQIR